MLLYTVVIPLCHARLLRPPSLQQQQCGFPPPYPRCNSTYPQQDQFAVRVVDRNPYGRPLVTSSEFPFNFNTAWFPAPDSSGVSDGLIVRVQENCTPNCPSSLVGMLLQLPRHQVYLEEVVQELQEACLCLPCALRPKHESGHETTQNVS